MFMNNDFSEQPKIHTVGVLPTRRPAEYYQELKSNDPAVHAMTDFTSKFAVTVPPDRQIDAALADMVRLSVRAMLVMRADSIIGLITSYDIEGPRPARFAEQPQAIIAGLHPHRIAGHKRIWRDESPFDDSARADHRGAE